MLGGKLGLPVGKTVVVSRRYKTRRLTTVQNPNARGGTRTPKTFRPPDPKSGASANSATLATLLL